MENEQFFDDEKLDKIIKKSFTSETIAAIKLIDDSMYSLEKNSKTIEIDKPDSLRIRKKPSNKFEKLIYEKLKDNLDRFNSIN